MKIDDQITLRVSGLASTMFLVDKASANAGFQKMNSMGSRGSHHFSMTLLKGKTVKETALFMHDVSEVVKGCWWAITDYPSVLETSLPHSSIEQLQSALGAYYRFEIKV